MSDSCMYAYKSPWLTCQYVYDSVPSTNPLPDFYIFFFVMMILNYSEDTAERSGLQNCKLLGIPFRNTIVLVFSIASAIRWILSAQNPFTG